MCCVPCSAVQSYNFVVGMSGYYIVRFELARLAGTGGHTLLHFSPQPQSCVSLKPLNVPPKKCLH
jgi:hypothetical protein